MIIRVRPVMAVLILLSILACGEDKNTTEPPDPNPDVAPPATISDLRVTAFGEGVILSWTAPGDDDSSGTIDRYDIRYAAGDLAAVWDSASTVPFDGAPAAAGEKDSVAIGELRAGLWQFGVRAADEVPNWSAISNIVAFEVPGEDSLPPAQVVDLAVVMATPEAFFVEWTAPGDDGSDGRAASYDLRYSTEPITGETWAASLSVDGVGTPRASGSRDGVVVSGLGVGQRFYFGLVVADEAQNESALSNVHSGEASNPVQMTFHADAYNFGAQTPAWSPDGESIAYMAFWDAPSGLRVPEIYVISADGGDPVRYTSLPDGAASPVWSPDGTQIAFSASVDGELRTELAVMDAAPGATYRTVASHPGRSTPYKTWSPGGAFLAYIVDEYDPPNPTVSDIYRVASSGGAPERLIGGWTCAGVDWSSDGANLVFSARKLGSFDLWVLPTNGGPESQVTNGSGNEYDPVWAPDGRWIGYQADAMSVWVCWPSGENPVRVTSDVYSRVSELAWSPDGSAIAYSARSEAASQIWIQRLR